MVNGYLCNLVITEILEPHLPTKFKVNRVISGIREKSSNRQKIINSPMGKKRLNQNRKDPSILVTSFDS